MGRALVTVFLVSVLLGLATIIVAVLDLAVHLFVTVYTRVDPPLLSFTSGSDGALLTVAAIYFFVVAPIVVAALVIEGSVHNRRHPPQGTTRRVEWKGQNVAAVLTAYDDEEAIGQAVDDFKAQPAVSEVIVVDNNSSDRTAEVAAAHGATLIREPRQGYGYACIGGMHYAIDHTPAQFIVLVEGDMTFFAEDLEKMLPYISECDMVLGTRTTRTLTHNGSQMDWFLAWGNLFLAFLIRLRYWDSTFLGRARLTDVGCTYRIIRRDALMRIGDQLRVGGNYFSPHMILIALRNNLSVVEVPIRFRERVGVSKGAGGSRTRAMGIGLQMVREIALH
jgi:cellulose synthase/poly-beta-1,6-N-acetylglucosamine synthase-like glycosyltransferase